MKKKVRRFNEGGSSRFDEDTYSRAKGFLRLQGIEDTPALDEKTGKGGTRTTTSEIDGDVPMTRTNTVEVEAPPKPPIIKAAARSVAKPAPKVEPKSYVGSTNDAGEEGVPRTRSPMVSDLGIKQQRQMEDKGSIYSKDFGKPRAEREAAAAVREAQSKVPVKKFLADRMRRRVVRPTGTESYAKGGAVSASRRADGIAQRGKTRGKLV